MSFFSRKRQPRSYSTEVHAPLTPEQEATLNAPDSVIEEPVHDFIDSLVKDLRTDR